LVFIGLIVQFTGIILTNAWVGYFGILFFSIPWVFLKFPKYRLVFLILGLIVFTGLALKFNRYMKSLETPVSINPESRQRIMMKGLIAIKSKPILGYGWANFDYAFKSVDWPIHMDQDVYVDKAHSALLEILVTTGLVGFIIYLLIIINVSVSLLHKKSTIYYYILATFLLLILHMQTNVISTSEEILFWIITGFSAKEA
jgi:O-antigen ligase